MTPYRGTWRSMRGNVTLDAWKTTTVTLTPDLEVNVTILAGERSSVTFPPHPSARRLQRDDAEAMGLEHRANRNAIALHVDNVEAIRSTLVQRGASCAGDTFVTGICQMASLSDRHGNALMLQHRYAPRALES